jgi:hypothetical protein
VNVQGEAGNIPMRGKQSQSVGLRRVGNHQRRWCRATTAAKQGYDSQQR